MDKKVLIAFALMIVAVATIGFVAATQTVSVAGIDYTLPDGYAPDESTGTSSEGMGIYYGDNGVILIMVTDDEAALTDVQTNSSYHEKTISNQTGYLYNDDGSVMFAYQKGSDIVFIGAPDEATVETLLK